MKQINYVLENFIVAPAILCWFLLLALVELCTLPFSRDDLNHEEGD